MMRKVANSLEELNLCPDHELMDQMDRAIQIRMIMQDFLINKISKFLPISKILTRIIKFIRMLKQIIESLIKFNNRIEAPLTLKIQMQNYHDHLHQMDRQSPGQLSK